MTIKFTEDSFSDKTNSAIKNTVLSADSMELRFKVNQLIAERRRTTDGREFTQSTLAELTGIRKGDISKYCNNKFRPTINLSHLFAMMIALRVSDISEILEVRLPSEEKTKFIKQSAEWKQEGTMPSELNRLLKQNIKLITEENRERQQR
ncbi:helix-turn-helix domain-containing protein [Vagococcus entomophilus]|uniref:HTH cro/C1-type domain-containing protein n=1 Tax=Vagococcus entomophilus TaxID=1160095 RepID=A0A430AKQ8_9ENTE|nr:helix-turn-helix domain-containing protein [Vagococcus entomophilus]RSU08649.1 hypothetical protein CBF30_05330 [Vagococcus entomophilus]